MKCSQVLWVVRTSFSDASTSASCGVHRASSCRVRCTCTSGVHRARSSRVRCTSACGEHRARSSRLRGSSSSCGVHHACSCRVRGTSAGGGVPCTRPFCVSSDNASGPALSEAPAPGAEFIAPSARTQFFSLSPASSDAETHFPIVTGTKSRKGIETPTCSLSRRRLVDKAGHELDVQVERVMRASVARLGYEWRRTKKRERNCWRGLCCISVMSCSRAQVMGTR